MIDCFGFECAAFKGRFRISGEGREIEVTARDVDENGFIVRKEVGKKRNAEDAEKNIQAPKCTPIMLKFLPKALLHEAFMLKAQVGSGQAIKISRCNIFDIYI